MPAWRRRAFERDAFTCQHCGFEGTPGHVPGTLQIHHVIPRKSGGGNAPANLLTLCFDCHRLADRKLWAESMRKWQIECPSFKNPIDVEKALARGPKREPRRFWNLRGQRRAAAFEDQIRQLEALIENQPEASEPLRSLRLSKLEALETLLATAAQTPLTRSAIGVIVRE